jgi:hypothetical protein
LWPNSIPTMCWSRRFASASRRFLAAHWNPLERARARGRTVMTARPGSLHEVARRVAGGEQAFDPALPEFLNSFYSRPEQREGAISQQPQALDALRRTSGTVLPAGNSRLGGEPGTGSRATVPRRKSGIAEGPPHGGKPNRFPAANAVCQQERAFQAQGCGIRAVTRGAEPVCRRGIAKLSARPSSSHASCAAQPRRLDRKSRDRAGPRCPPWKRRRVPPSAS